MIYKIGFLFYLLLPFFATVIMTSITIKGAYEEQKKSIEIKQAAKEVLIYPVIDQGSEK